MDKQTYFSQKVLKEKTIKLWSRFSQNYKTCT